MWNLRKDFGEEERKVKEIMKELIKIQQELKAPKNQFNKFGGYKYRNCESILEAVKPILGECVLTLNDELVNIGDRYYIKATAKLSNGSDTVEVSAYAREEETKKGMDGSQITGTASSYARKYALNGLFLIDDTKDADTDEFTKQTKDVSKEKAEPKQEPEEELVSGFATDLEKKTFIDLCKSLGVEWEDIRRQAGYNPKSKMNKEEHGRCLIILKEIEDNAKN